MIDNFEYKLTSRGMTCKEVVDYFDKAYIILMNLVLVPFQLFSIIQAFIPFERTNGYYDLGECLIIGIFVAIFIEIIKRISFKVLKGVTGVMALVNLENAYNHKDKEVVCATLDKIKKKIDKKKKEN